MPMIDEKRIQEVKANIPRYLEENLITKRQPSSKKILPKPL